MSNSTQSLQQFFDNLAPQRDYWISQSAYYYQELFKLHQFFIPTGKKVLDIGCGTGDLLASVKPKIGMGIDFSHEMIKIASRKYSHLSFQVMDAHRLEFKETFDYVILSNLVGYADDVWQVFRELQKVCHSRTRIIVTNYNYLWQPLFAVFERLRYKMPDRIQNWLPQEFIDHFLYLNGFEVIKKGKYLHCPIDLGFLSDFVNTVGSTTPFVSSAGLIEYLVCRPTFLFEKKPQAVSVAVVVPTHEEAGNIEPIVELMPKIGKQTELVFVDLPGKDATLDKIKQVIKGYKGPFKIKYVVQGEKSGKVGALRLGVAHTNCEIVLIYDADVTVPPTDLLKFYLALIEGKAEIVNGTRLVYPTEKGAMRFVNHLGNLIFAYLFTWGLGQHFTDTLCGSKGFWRDDFLEFESTRTNFENLDRYGDFYLLLGAYRRNLKIAEVPVRYKMRKYGDTKLDRVRNGWQFLRMFLYFFWNFKIHKRKEF